MSESYELLERKDHAEASREDDAGNDDTIVLRKPDIDWRRFVSGKADKDS